jgi:hypothetical protein
MIDYEIKYQKYKKKYDKLKKKFIYKINFVPEYKLLYNNFVNSCIENNNKIFIENIIDLNYLINDLNINNNNSDYIQNLNKSDKKLETIIEEDDFLI